MREDDDVTLGIQAWAGDGPPAPEKFTPVSGPPKLAKPWEGGLWTSTWHPEYGSGWIEWCLENDFRGPTFDTWLLTPDPSARVYEIDSLADLVRLVERYPSQPIDASRCVDRLDWTAVAVDWEAVHLTDDGQWSTRLSYPVSLYGWDCESTLWFRWCFIEVAHFGEWKAA